MNAFLVIAAVLGGLIWAAHHIKRGFMEGLEEMGKAVKEAEAAAAKAREPMPPKIVIAYTRIETLVIYSDLERNEYRLCATFPPGARVAAGVAAEALAAQYRIGIQEHRG